LIELFYNLFYIAVSSMKEKESAPAAFVSLTLST